MGNSVPARNHGRNADKITLRTKHRRSKMKKLIAATAIVLAGICTNAATVVWIEG
jgi:hypothetical protein